MIQKLSMVAASTTKTTYSVLVHFNLNVCLGKQLKEIFILNQFLQYWLQLYDSLSCWPAWLYLIN